VAEEIKEVAAAATLVVATAMAAVVVDAVTAATVAEAPIVRVSLWNTVASAVSRKSLGSSIAPIVPPKSFFIIPK